MRKFSVPVLMLFALALCSNSMAQDHRNCASHETFQYQLQKHPEMAARVQAIEDFTRRYKLPQRGNQRGAPVYTIPVVVHVLWNVATDNISDAQIISQMDALNRDFQLNNADTVNIPAAFKPLTADCQISFCLAQRGPDGNPTTGIIRKYTPKNTFDAVLDDAKFSSMGGNDGWDPSQYLNIWVVPKVLYNKSAILGYAQLPGAPANIDGVVMPHRYFGSVGTAATAPFNLGRTGTHEVGHWLNLSHIWGDEAACLNDDGVGDTPLQADKNFGCPAFPRLDACTGASPGVMFMNYMDYVNDACMIMFSEGQKQRMYAQLAPGGYRASLATSQGCVAPAAAACSNVTSLIASNITTTGATISWTAVSGATTYDLQYGSSAAGPFTTVSGITATSSSLSGLSAGTQYYYNVRANCSGGNGNYHTLLNFVTPGSAPCADVLEPNNSSTAAATVGANSTTNALIASSTDRDWYKFTNTTAARNIKVTLTNLPVDCDIRLYNPSGTNVLVSQNSGLTNETMIYNTTTVGTYRIQVYGYSNAYHTSNCYSMTVQTSATAFREATAKANAPMLQVYPSPAQNKVNVVINADQQGEAEIIVTNQLGAVVLKQRASLVPGENTNWLDMSAVPSGVYLVKVQQGAKNSVQKLVIQK
jgi:Pregnancy-associated plasma protein-A/Secretion system C-terminal sorting domain/Bacterial pre-peptidase C-terminal domain/Fibronectin type III domain